MSFISFSLQYYREELRKLEEAGSGMTYRAKQLLKILDDLVDEGYTELSEKLEQDCQGVTRLRNYLKAHHAEPFAIERKIVEEADVTYETGCVELQEAIAKAVEQASAAEARPEYVVAAQSTERTVALEKTVTAQAAKTGVTVAQNTSRDVFMEELIAFCDWVGYEENTAYIFLLRDTLLPYVYYKAKNRNGLYPWLLGRKAIDAVVGKQWVDDEIRAAVIRALENGRGNHFLEFCEAVLPDIRETVSRYPKLESVLRELLKTVKEERIVVVESGCSGTFPLLLMSVDSRVDMRMYTTYPYLLEAYGSRVFTERYEDIRLFETMYSQDLYFRFADLKNGKFYVNRCDNKQVEEKALAEIRGMLTAARR